MFFRPLQLEASTALLLASSHKAPGNWRSVILLISGPRMFLGVVPRRMLERSDEARDLREERGILLAGPELVFR